MTDEHEEHRSVGKARGMGWRGISASILLHAVFAFILFFHFPLDVAEPQKEESVSVEIVPPPEEPEQKAEEQKKAEEKKAEEKKAEEAKKEEPPPPPPEPEKKEEAKKEEPPPPPPPPEPPKQEAKKPDTPPPPSKQEAAKQEQTPGEEKGQQGQPLPVLRPVFQFGEKDSGPRVSEKGNAAQEVAKPPEQTEPNAAATEQAKPLEEKSDAVTEAAPGNPLPDDIKAPEVDIASANPQQNGPSNGAAPDATRLAIVASPPVAVTKIDPSMEMPIPKSSEMTEVKTLFSTQSTGDPIATRAWGNMPRGLRAGELCGTELSQQLAHASPTFRFPFVPTYSLPTGTVLTVRKGAFKANGKWYDLKFRCEIDEKATKVVSFAIDIGDPIPRSEWQSRRLPEL